MEEDDPYVSAIRSTFVWTLCGITACLFLLSLFWMILINAALICTGFIFKFYQIVRPRKEGESLDVYWSPARRFFGNLWKAWGELYYGYEVVNFDRIPKKGPALLVYYHGVVELDWIFLIAKAYTEGNIPLWSIVDRFFENYPAKDALKEGAGLCIGTMEDSLKMLKEGKIIGIAPGGTRESLFSEPYSLLWNRRTGFAKLALKAQVPIIPVFTRNIREAFFVPRLFKRYFRPIYERTRSPYMVNFGGFPAKLTTFIGEPVSYDPESTPEELAEKVANSLRALIKEHQSFPRSYIRAIWERWLHLVRKRNKKG